MHKNLLNTVFNPSYSLKPWLKLFLRCFYMASSAGQEKVLFSYTAPIKNMRLLHIFQCDNFCSFVNELSEGKRYDRLK